MVKKSIMLIQVMIAGNEIILQKCFVMCYINNAHLCGVPNVLMTFSEYYMDKQCVQSRVSMFDSKGILKCKYLTEHFLKSHELLQIKGAVEIFNS